MLKNCLDELHAKQSDDFQKTFAAFLLETELP